MSSYHPPIGGGGAIAVGPYSFVIYRDDDGLTKAYNTKTGNIDYQNAEAVTLFDAAISGANNKGPIFVKQASGGYVFNSGLNLVNRSFHLVGEAWRFTLGGASRNGNTEIRKGFSGGTLLDMNNTGSADQKLENFWLDGGNAGDAWLDTGTGIDWFLTGGNYGDKLVNVVIEDFDIGLRLRRAVYVDFYGLIINSCSTYGLWLDSTITPNDYVNTSKFFGGTLVSNGYNVFATRAAGVQFYGTVMEAPTSGSMLLTSGSIHVVVDGCSFEKNGVSGTIFIEDNGSNNRFRANRFDSDVEYTAIKFGASAKNSVFEDNVLQFNVSGVTCHIIASSGASGLSFINNTPGHNTRGTVKWEVSGRDGGVGYTAYGNIGLRDQTSASGITIAGHSGHMMLKEAGQDTLGLYNNLGVSGSNLYVGGLNTAIIRDVNGNSLGFLSSTQWNFNDKITSNIGTLTTNSGTNVFNQSGGSTGFRGTTNFSGIANFNQSGGFSGQVTIGNNIDFRASGSISTSGTAGSAGALPTTPAGYLSIQVSGVDRKVAYYDP